VRVPYCDVDLVSEMANVPAAARFPAYTLKPWLRKIAQNVGVPSRILKRKKQGFMIPIGRWFRAELRDYLEAGLHSNQLPDLLDGPAVQRLMGDHLAGRANHTHVLWAILLLGRWMKKNMEISEISVKNVCIEKG
jgi:asparagine synthase (glutamine-hydrolysing)